MNIKSNAPAVIVPPYFSDVVTLRVKKHTFGKSGAGNEQYTLECEIVQPAEVELEGRTYVLAGQDIKFYLGLSDEKTGNAKQSPLKNTQDFHEKLGLPLEFEQDAAPYEGLMFEYYLQSQEKMLKRRTKNPETGKLEWENVIDPTTHKPRSLGWEWSNQLGNTIGPSALSVEGGF